MLSALLGMVMGWQSAMRPLPLHTPSSTLRCVVPTPSDPEFAFLVDGDTTFWATYVATSALAVGATAVLTIAIDQLAQYNRGLASAVDELSAAVTAPRRRRWADGCELLEVETPIDKDAHKEWWVCPEELRSSEDCIDVYIDGERTLACAY